MKTRHFILLGVALVVLVGVIYLLGGWSILSSQNDQKPLKIAFNTWIGYSSFYIAEKEGLLDKYHVKVETSVIDPLPEKNAAMLRGDLDGMGGTIDSAVISDTNGLSARVIMMFDRSNGTDGILTTNDIKTVRDLAGKSVAVEEGFVDHFFLLYVLDKEGLPPDTIHIVPMTTDEAGAAFAAGKVDVAVTYEPMLDTALSRPNSHVLVSSAHVEPILADTLLVSNDAIQGRADDLRNLIRALMEANSLWKKNPEKYMAFVAEKWNWKPQDVASTLRTVEIYDCADELRLFGTSEPGPLYHYVSKASELWLKSEVIKQGIDPEQVIDPEFVRQVCR